MRTVLAFLLTAAATAYAQTLAGPARDRGRLIGLAAEAFEVDTFHLIAPGWFATTRISIEAETTPELRDALIQRYSLIWHREPRLRDVWILKLHDREPPRKAPPGASEAPGNTRITAAVTWSEIACRPCVWESVIFFLQFALQGGVSSGKPGVGVVDETGLKGFYYFKVLWKSGDDADMVRAWREGAGIDLLRSARVEDFVVIDKAIDPDAPPEPAPPRFACEASAAVRADIDALPRMEDWSLSFEERIAPRRALARRNPYDVFVQLALQDAIRAAPHVTREWDEALETYRKLESPLLADFLEARLRLPLFQRRSFDLLNSIVRRDPDFPWAHLALVEWTELHAPSDAERAERHLREFRRLCPQSLEPLSHLSAVRDRDLLRGTWSDLGGAISRRIDLQSIEKRPLAWKLALRANENPEFVPGIVQRDLNWLRLLRFSIPWARMLREGYKLTGDEAGRRWIEKIVLAEWPASSLAYEINPRLRDLPQSAFARFRTKQAAPKITAAEAEAAAREYLDTIHDYPDLAFAVPPAPLQVAELYRRAGIHMNEIRDLVRAALMEIEAAEKYRRQSDIPEQLEAAEKNIRETYQRAVGQAVSPVQERR